MGRRCKICSSPEGMALAAEMIAAGQPDRAVAEALGGMDRMSVQRHRTQHMTGKVGVVAQRRQAAEGRLAAFEAAPEALFDPASYLSRDGIAADLDVIDRRLGIAAMAAAVDGRAAALAQLSAQQLRLMEARARLGEVGGYGRDRGNGSGGSGRFDVNITIGGRAHSVITATLQPRDREGVPDDMTWRLPSPPEPERHPLAAGGPATVFRGLASP